jgi:hypothetical protein
MSKWLVVFTLLANLVALPAYADCAAPQLTSPVPSGATASREDMLAAQRAIKAYDLAVNDYVACMDRIHGSADKQTAVLRELQEIADRFNAEFRAFKAKNSA